MSIALVGAGPRGHLLAAAFSKKIPVSRVCEYGASARELSKFFKARLSSCSEIIEDEEISTVIIASPVQSLQHYVEIFHGHKHLFVEKPGLTSSGFNPSRSSNHVTYVNYSWLMEGFKFPETGDIDINWTKPHTNNRDLVLNLLVHPVSLCIKNLGDPTSSSVTRREDAVSATLTFNDRQVTISLSIDPQFREKITIADRHYDQSNRKKTIDDSVDDFLCAISGEHKHISDLEFARKVIQCIGR